MTHPDHFLSLGGKVAPQEWMQLRQVASEFKPSVSRSYAPVGGGNKSELIHEVEAHWTNDTPVPQLVYGMVTRGGSQVTLQARSRGYLAVKHGFSIASDGKVLNLDDVSKFGTGADIGKGGSLSVGTAFCVAEVRQNANTVPLMPHITGWFQVNPGEQFNAKVRVGFVSEFWESTFIDLGDSSTESSCISGATQLDLFAVPGEIPVTVRTQPTVVGVSNDVEVTGDTEVAVPAGTAAGDIILAVVANQFGLITDITPVETGWDLIHSRDGGWEDVHLKIFARVATAAEPGTYSFNNGVFAEETAALVTVRNADHHLSGSWSVSSSLLRRWFDTTDEHVCLSVDHPGQALLCLSYFTKGSVQPAITQTPPEGMTEIADISASVSSMGLAWLAAPPRPTQDRKFKASTAPSFLGHSITVSLLIAGKET